MIKAEARPTHFLALFSALCIGLSAASSVYGSDKVIGFTEPVRTIELAAAETGILTELTIKRGDPVTTGQRLGTLDIAVLQSRRDLAEARVASTAKLQSAKIKVRRAEQNYQQYQQLRSEGHGGKRELEVAASDLELATIEVEAADDEIRLNQLELRRIDAELARRQIVTPITGVVSEVHREVGEFVAMTEPIVVTIVDLSALRIRFYPRTSIAESLQVGDGIFVEFEHSGNQQKAIIDFIAPVIDADSNTIQIDVLLQNQQGQFRSGRRCALLTGNHTPALNAPFSTATRPPTTASNGTRR